MQPYYLEILTFAPHSRENAAHFSQVGNHRKSLEYLLCPLMRGLHEDFQAAVVNLATVLSLCPT